MEINLNNQKEFTIENVKALIASGDDSINTQFRVTDDGLLFISEVVGNKELDGILFRFETNVAGHVGEGASKNNLWVERIFTALTDNWPNPTSKLIINF